MSFKSCDNSAILPAPSAYLSSTVGYSTSLAINSTATASGASVTAASFTLPKGIWLVSGLITVDATVGGQTSTGTVQVRLDGVATWTSTVATGTDSIPSTLSSVVQSNGTNVLSIFVQVTTSGASTYTVLASPQSVVQCTRIA
ncbi:MAG: hypothetical protein EBU90_21970 [Proteobacteria bacterium]|nr:hypothetical protein [Pseudomonadota bacterium]NBP16000.1 hypothetical protein [bacterium]